MSFVTPSDLMKGGMKFNSPGTHHDRSFPTIMPWGLVQPTCTQSSPLECHSRGCWCKLSSSPLLSSVMNFQSNSPHLFCSFSFLRYLLLELYNCKKANTKTSTLHIVVRHSYAVATNAGEVRWNTKQLCNSCHYPHGWRLVTTSFTSCSSFLLRRHG